MSIAITSERFAEAQKYESAYWTVRSRDHVGMIHDLESPFVLGQHLQAAGYLDHTFRRLLDVGCGALGLGILWMMRAKEKVGLDPLRVVPATTGCQVVDEFVRAVQADCSYVCSQAERMPFDDQSFDCIACNNVLDHVQDPESILREIKRCLEPDGLLAFAVDTHSIRGVAERKIMKRIAPNSGSLAGHPYEWTERQMSRLLLRHGFKIESHRQRSIKGLVAGGVFRATWLLRHA